MGKLGSKVVHCFCFFSLFHYFFDYFFSNSVRMEDMLCFENIDESTSTLPFLTNSKVDVAGFVNLQRVAPIKKTHFHTLKVGKMEANHHISILSQSYTLQCNYLYNHSMHGHSRKEKPPISCAYAHSLCSKSK
jgi:hypothetical protein